ncbi:hypothetical protein DM02DRAFT_31995 [Periconia macrospinosa]|uniref:SWIM-type domain-containing protein n=1 Tax=Periconia macrospinosa TaxID=97972 RepID=A0A2V1CX91_9PLEO|nr:hypothetical protein DM02DRAFT_31995 [Periconia macrospinosa]
MHLWSQQSISFPWTYRKELYVYINRIISNYALSQIEHQHALGKDELRELQKNPQNKRTNCKCIFQAVHGYPCKHDLVDPTENDQVLKPEMFHKHWWIDCDVTEDEGRRSRILSQILLGRDEQTLGNERRGNQHKECYRTSS